MIMTESTLSKRLFLRTTVALFFSSGCYLRLVFFVFLNEDLLFDLILHVYVYFMATEWTRSLNIRKTVVAKTKEKKNCDRA